MKSWLFWVFSFMFLLQAIALKAQQYSLQHFSVNEGLIQSDVNKIIQDEKRFIWIATNGGISRFDGLKFRNFNIPIGETINDIVEGDQHEIYFLTKQGIGIIRNDSVYSYYFGTNMLRSQCRNLVFNDGKLWMITNCGITFFDGKNFHVTQPIISSDLDAVWFSIDSNKAFWIEDSNKSIWHTENNKLTKLNIVGKALRNGSEMAVSRSNDVYKIGTGEMSFLDHFDQPELNNLQQINNIWYYSSGNRLFRKKGNQTEILFEVPENDKINMLYIDKLRRLWIGTHNGFYYSNSLAFKKYYIPGKLEKQIWGVIEDDAKNLWFASYGKGLTKYDGNDFKRIDSYKSQLKTDSFYIGSLKKSNGNLLFTTTKGVLQFDGKQFKKVPHLPAQIYLHIYEDVDNQAMIYAGENSLVFEKNGFVKVFDNVEFNLPQVFDILKDKNNIYRMGGAENTVFYDGKNFLAPDTSKFGYTKGVYSSVTDSKGNIWIATRYGIYFYDYKTCKPVLTNEIAEAVLDLKSYFGNIYFGTIKGVGLISLDRFYKNEKAVSYFDYKNGYQGEEVVQNGAIVCSDSSIWIPSTRGVVKFVPSMVVRANHLPPVHLESLIVYDHKGGKKSISGFKLNENKTIDLDCKCKEIEINFLCVSLSDPEGITYRYRLEKYDYDWHEVPYTVRSIKYDQLPVGEYLFRIEAFNKEGVLSSMQSSFNIKIAPAFYQKWWFRILTSIFILLILFEVFRILKEKELRKAVAQQQMLKLKADALAAQMNPHFVFNCISSINALINMGHKQEATLYLGRFATLLRNVLKSVRVNEISLEEELLMIENYMKLEQTRYSKPFNYSIIRPEGISPTLIMIPPLIIQPFIENSILHGFTGLTIFEKRINILAVISGERLTVIIEDNGKGISSDKQRETGLGTKITKERIALIEKHAFVRIESHTDENQHGTIVTIEIPLKIKKIEND